MSKRNPGLPIPGDWNGTDWCRFSICWPDSLEWRAILAGFISTPLLGRAWDGATGSITDVQQIGAQIYENNLDWRYSIVSTCSEGMAEFVAALRYLADKTAQSGCCGGPGQPGGTGTGGTGKTGATPAEPVEGGVPPAGFDTWEDYQDYKCAVATWLIDTIIHDLETMGTYQLAGFTAVAMLPVLAATLLDPIPGDELFLLAGLLAGLAYYGASALTDATTAAQNARDDLICSIVQENSPGDAYTDLQAVFGDALDAQSNDSLVRAWGKQVFGLMVTIDGLNKAFVKDNTRVYPAGDCNCTDPFGCQDEWDTPAGEPAIVSDTYVNGHRVIEIVTNNTNSRTSPWYGCGIGTGDPPACNGTMTVEVIDGDWVAVPAFGGGTTYGDVIIPNGSPYKFPVTDGVATISGGGCHFLTVFSQSPMTIRITLPEVDA